MRILRGVIIALLVSVLLVAGLIVLMIESEPVVDVKAAEQVADADTVHELLAQLESSVSDRT